MAPLVGERGLKHLVVVTYSDYLKRPTDFKLPEFVAAPRQTFSDACAVARVDVLARRYTHRSVTSTLVGGVHWFGRTQDAVYLSVLPWFHVTGMAGSMNGPLYIGATLVILPRWDRDAAAQCMQRYRVTV